MPFVACITGRIIQCTAAMLTKPAPIANEAICGFGISSSEFFSPD